MKYGPKKVGGAVKYVPKWTSKGIALCNLRGETYAVKSFLLGRRVPPFRYYKRVLSDMGKGEENL